MGTKKKGWDARRPNPSFESYFLLGQNDTNGF